ncbi:lipase [Echinicola pacifica]|uniref:Lipase n=1 Tax=Echinicola pacifica TaxID=346377 RepID=A0A918PJA9_9BACT|nr:alpha/beta hydrolase [Echinicola pacifica]GGZ12926.1 lipase [Echinicola pacifica]
MKKSPSLIIPLFLLTFIAFGQGQSYKTLENIPYYEQSIREADTYMEERCVLDLYLPEGKEDFATVVWFHGGGLTGGEKEIPQALKDQGLAIIGVNYRLYPKVSAPTYIADAAAAIAWTLKNIHQYGGDSSLVFLSGHSAGGYLAAMVGMDKSWLANYGLDANDLAGLIPFSGHMITHFTVREERGLPGHQALIDELAPLYFVRPDAPPLLLITGDREMELLGRYEENAYMMRMMKVAGHTETTLYEMDGYGHNMTAPAFPLLLSEVERVSKFKATSTHKTP